MTIQLSPPPIDDNQTPGLGPTPARRSTRKRLAAGVVVALAIGSLATTAILSNGDRSRSEEPRPLTVTSTPEAGTATEVPRSDPATADTEAGTQITTIDVPGAGLRTRPGLPDGYWRNPPADRTTPAAVPDPDCSRGGPC